MGMGVRASGVSQTEAKREEIKIKAMAPFLQKVFCRDRHKSPAHATSTNAMAAKTDKNVQSRESSRIIRIMGTGLF